MEVSFHPHAPAALPPGKNLLIRPPLLCNRSLKGWVILQSRSGHFGEEKNPLPLMEFQILPTRCINIYLALSKITSRVAQ